MLPSSNSLKRQDICLRFFFIITSILRWRFKVRRSFVLIAFPMLHLSQFDGDRVIVCGRFSRRLLSTLAPTSKQDSIADLSALSQNGTTLEFWALCVKMPRAKDGKNILQSSVRTRNWLPAPLPCLLRYCTVTSVRDWHWLHAWYTSTVAVFMSASLNKTFVSTRILAAYGM